MTRGARLAGLLALAAWLHVDGRLWILGPMGLVWLAAAVADWRAGRRAPLAVTAGLVVAGAAWAVAGYAHATEAESAIRALYAAPLASGTPASATADGPTGPVTARIRMEGGRPVVAFIHREPPWVGDGALRALAAQVAAEGRLPRPDAYTLRAPVERAGLRALELALAPQGPGLAALPARVMRAEQDAPAVMVVPVLLLLALAIEAALSATRRGVCA